LKIVVDSYAWIELFVGSDKGRIVKDRLGKAEEVYTPDIVLAEIARKYHRENIGIPTIEARLQTISEASLVIPIDKVVAVKGAELDFELKRKAREGGLKEPSLFDALILAFSKVVGASLMTGDEHFRGMSDVIWIGD